MTDYIELDATHIHETDRAVLLDFGDGGIWVPKSVMNEWPDEGQTEEIVIAEWFALKEGLI